MANKKVCLLLNVKAHRELMEEFHEVWGNESLPMWAKHGARHLGSYISYVGDPINEIHRIFEFDSLAEFEQWEEYLKDSEEGKALKGRLSKYIISVERKLWHSIY